MGVEDFLLLVPTVLGVIAALTGVIGAYLTSVLVRRRQKAEAELAQKLVSIYLKKRQINQLDAIRNKIVHGENIDDALLHHQ